MSNIAHNSMPGNFQSDNTAFESRWASVLGDRISKGKPLPSNRIQGVTVSGASTSQVVQPAPLLPIPIQAWWASFAMRGQPRWTFLALLVIMLEMISIYMVAALVLPDITGETHVDLRQHFFAHRSWFFGALLAAVLFSLLKNLTLHGHLPNFMDSAFQFAFCVAAIAAAVIGNEWFHKLLAPAFGLLFGVYVGLLFARL